MDTSTVCLQVEVGRLERASLPLPVIGPDEGLLKVENVGICGSDVMRFRGQHAYSTYPTILGHEPVGIISQIGDQAAERWEVKVGDRVAVEAQIPCRRCANCHQGDFTRCTNRKVLGMVPSYVAPALWGAYSEYLYLHPGSTVHPIAPNISGEVAATFNAIACGVAWSRQAGVTLGDRVVILGAGQRGLACAISAKMLGASSVTITGLSRDRPKLDVASALGIEFGIDVETEDVVSKIVQHTEGDMADVIIDTVPSDPETVAQASAAVRKGGTILVAGRKEPGLHAKQLAIDDVVGRGIRIQGARPKTRDDFKQAISIIESGRFALEYMCTHTYPLEDTEYALETLANGSAEEAVICVNIAPWA